MSQLSAEIKDIYWYDNLGLVNIAQVGGKNASLGKMISNMAEEGGVRVPLLGLIDYFSSPPPAERARQSVPRAAL